MSNSLRSCWSLVIYKVGGRKEGGYEHLNIKDCLSVFLLSLRVIKKHYGRVMSEISY